MAGYEEEAGVENLSSSSPPSNSPILSLQKAIEMGEYDPEALSKFSEWNELSRHAQFELIRQGIKNRDDQLMQQWAEIFNVLDFSKKPELQTALKNIEEKRHVLAKEKEKLYLEYSK